MQRRSEKQERGAGSHLRHDRLAGRFGIKRSFAMAVRPYQRRAIVGGVVVERPHHVDEIFGAADLTSPHILIAMRQLRQRAGMDRDRLRQVELDGVAPGGEHPLRSEENKSDLQSLMRISYALF